MWNSFQTDAFQGIQAELTTYEGGNGDYIHAYVAKPLGPGPFPGLVLIHHMPGWDEFYFEFARRFAAHGYTVIAPDLYCRAGHGSPDDIAAKIRGEGGVADDQVSSDCKAAADWLRSLPTSNGKVGVTGTCSGGRHAFMTAGRNPGVFDALIDFWGGRVVAGADELTPKQPVAPVDYTKDLTCPVLGIFGNDDQNPSPAAVNVLEEEMKKHGKDYDFHRYDGAGHGFFYHDRPNYRQAQTMDAQAKVFAFFGKHLKGE